MKYLVGCPVSGRNWILPTWFEHVDKAFAELETPSFVFLVPSSDEETRALLEAETDRDIHIVYSEEEPRTGKPREWVRIRYEHMVTIRNQLLEKVRELEPKFFLSLDSDILLHPEAVKSALEVIPAREAAAVGLKAYLTLSGKVHPNSGHWNSRKRFVNYSRYDIERIGKVDILMAAKLMTPFAYNQDYAYHQSGEDLGWSINVTRAGGKLYMDGRFANKHVMEERMLGIIDKRVGW